MSHSQAFDSRPARAIRRDTWCDVLVNLIAGGAFTMVMPVMLLSLVWCVMAERRLHHEGLSTDALVVARRHVTGEGNSYFLTIAYAAPIQDCSKDSITGPAPALCTPKIFDWTDLWTPFSQIGVPIAEYYVDNAALASFSPSGPRSFFRSEVSVNPELYRALPEGSTVPLRYARSNPSVSRLAQQSFLNPMEVFWGVGLMLLFPFVGIYCCRGALAIGYRMTRLACFGRRTSGLVVDCWIESHDESEGTSAHYCVAFRFQPHDGPAQLAAEINKRAYWRLEPGCEVMVEFLPQQPTICRLAL
jgi:hypothetical protein